MELFNKEEAPACRKTSQSTKRYIAFVKQSFYFFKNSLLLNWEVIKQASESSLSKELHGSAIVRSGKN